MNRNDDEEDHLMEWGLRERLGGETPSDLVELVRARVGEHVPTDVAPRGVHGRRSRWLAAAALLLGTAVVCGVGLWPAREHQAGVAPPVVVKELPLAPVNSLEDAAALAADTRGVEANGVDDAVIAALTRLRNLEVLVVREPWNEAFGLSPKMQPPEHPRHVTNASWRHFGAFTKLRRLELSGTVMAGLITGADLADAAAMLERLPLLERLGLRFLDTPDAVLGILPRLRGLRELDLSLNHGFGEEGVKAILECLSLRKLSLRGCQQLQGTWIARLHALPELEDLDLSMIDDLNWRSGPVDFAEGNVRRAMRAQGLALGKRRGAGVTDEALAGLVQSPRLRVLDVSSGCWTAAGLAQLGASRTLVELNACGAGNPDHSFVAALPRGLLRLEVCADYTDAFCAAVREHLTSLRHINVAACGQITDRGLADLLAMPSLRVLDMRQMRGLTAASIDAIAAATWLEEIDLRHCDFVTAQHVLRLRKALPNLRKLQTSVSDQDLAAAAALPDPIQVRTKQEIEALPGDTRNVNGLDIEDDCMPALSRLRKLERLEITAIWALPTQTQHAVRSITDAGLRQLKDLSSLRILHLRGQVGLLGEGFDVLRQLPTLEEVSVVKMKVSDAGLASLTALPLLAVLSIQYSQGFGRPTLAAIAQLPALRELSLSGCGHVEQDWLALLGGMRRLELLDLGMIGSGTYFLSWPGPLTVPKPGSGVTDTVLEALGKLTALRELHLGQAAGITGAGLRHLQGLPALASIDLSNTPVTGADLRWLPAGLTSLTLRHCENLGLGPIGTFLRNSDLGSVLASAMPRLRTLDLQGCNVGIAGLKSLLAAKSLRSLDLSYCPAFGMDSSATDAETVVQCLTALTWLEGLTLRGWTAFSEPHWVAVRAMPNLKRLDTDTGTETLR